MPDFYRGIPLPDFYRVYDYERKGRRDWCAVGGVQQGRESRRRRVAQCGLVGWVRGGQEVCVTRRDVWHSGGTQVCDFEVC